MSHDQFFEWMEKYVENRLDSAEQEKLFALLRSDRDARRQFWECVEQHAAIGDILSTSRGRDAARLEQMESLPVSAPVPSPAGSVSPGLRLARWLAATVAATLLGLFALRSSWFGSAEGLPQTLAQVVELEGALAIQSPSGGVRSASLGADVFEGETLRVSGTHGFAVFEYPDQSRYEISAGTVVRLTQAVRKKGAARAKELFLVEGMIRPTFQQTGPLVITTPQAQLQVVNTSFVVSQLAGEPARVDVEKGEATVVRTNDQQAITVHSGESVLVRDESLPMEVTRLPTISQEPSREISVRGVLSGFYPRDASVIQAITSREQRTIRGLAQESTALPTTISGNCVVQNDSGSHLAFYGADQRVWVWDTVLRQPLGQVSEPVSKDPLLSLSADGQTLLTVDKLVESDHHNRQVRVWNSATGRLRWSYQAVVSVRNLTFSPDGQLVAVAVGDLGIQKYRKLHLFDAHTGEPRGEMAPMMAHQFGLSFSPDGRTLVTSFPNHIQVWDVATSSLLTSIDAHQRIFQSLAYSPDAKLLAGRSLEGEIWIWNVTGGETVAVLRGPQRRLDGISFSPDGMQLLTRSQDRLLVWDVVPSE